MKESDLINLGFKKIKEYDPMDLEHPEWHYYELCIGDLDIYSCSDNIANQNELWHVMFEIHDCSYLIDELKMLQDLINILQSSCLNNI